MNLRSSKIIAYKSKNSNEMLCRACLGHIRGSIYHNDNRVCDIWFYSHQCCSYGGNTGDCWTDNWYFSNNLHEIILSTDVCKLCKKEDCLFDNKTQNCEMASYFTIEYLKNIKRVGIKNITEY